MYSYVPNRNYMLHSLDSLVYLAAGTLIFPVQYLSPGTILQHLEHFPTHLSIPQVYWVDDRRLAFSHLQGLLFLSIMRHALRLGLCVDWPGGGGRLNIMALWSDTVKI